MNETTAPEPTPGAGRGRKLAGWLVRIALFGAIFYAATRWQGRNHLAQGTPAPRFELPSVDGAKVNLQDYKGKTVLLHFWATWCGVCRQEFSMLNRLRHNLGDDAVLLSVVADGDSEGLTEFMHEQGIEYPVIKGTDKLLAAYKVNAFPTNYFIDKQGNVAGTSVGMSTEWASRARLSCAR